MNTTAQPEKTFHYGFHCVAYLDILGQRSKLRQLSRVPRYDDATKKLLAETAGYVLRCRSLLATCFEQFAKPTLFIAGLPPDAQERILTARRSVKIRCFSDTMIMQISCQGDEEQVGPVIGIYGCIASCCILHLVALSSKRPMRGGIDVGPGMDIAEDEVYGPVLEHAHYLESQVADYPRVVASDYLVGYLAQIANQTIVTPLGHLAKSIAAKCLRYITTDTDGNAMLDFLGIEMAGLSSAEERQSQSKLIGEYINEQTEKAYSDRDQKLLGRYIRLGQYFEVRAELWQRKEGVMATQPINIFGNPTFSQQVLVAFPKFFAACPRLTDSLNDLTGRAVANPDPHHRVIINLGLLTGISGIELVTLAGNGLGQGAMKIARTVMESAINAEYIRRNPAECDLYLKWHWVEQHKLLAYVQQYAPNEYAQLAPATIQQIETEFQNVRNLFENAAGNLRQSWCSVNLADRAIQTDFAGAYRLINPLSSQLIHGTFGGLSRHFDLSQDEHRISIPPSLEYVGEALIGAHMCIIKMIETLANTFGWTPLNNIVDLTNDFHHVWDGPAPH